MIDQDGLTLPDRQYYMNAPSREDDLVDESNPDSVTAQYKQLLQSVISLLGGKNDNQGIDFFILLLVQRGMMMIKSNL